MILLAYEVVEKFNKVLSFYKKRLPVLRERAATDPTLSLIEEGNSLVEKLASSSLREFPKLLNYGHPVYNDFIVRNALGIAHQVDAPYPSNNSSLSEDCQEHIAKAVANWYNLYKHEILTASIRSILSEAKRLPYAGKHVRNYAYHLAMSQLEAVESIPGFREYNYHLLKPATKAEFVDGLLFDRTPSQEAIQDLNDNFFTKAQVEASVNAIDKIFVYSGYKGLLTKKNLIVETISSRPIQVVDTVYKGKPYATHKHDLMYRIKEANSPINNYNVWSPVSRAEIDHKEYVELPVLWTAICYFPGLYTWNALTKPDFQSLKKVLAFCCKDKYTKYRLVFVDAAKVNMVAQNSKFDTFKVMVPEHLQSRTFEAGLCFENKGKLFGWAKGYNPFHFVW